MNELTTTPAGQLVGPGDLATERATIAAVVAGLQSAHTQRAYRRVYDNFLAWYAGQGRPPLSKATVRGYLVHLQDDGAGPAVVNQALSALKTLVKEMADNGQMTQDNKGAITDIKSIKSETLPAGRSLASGELGALLATCGSTTIGIRDAAVISLLYSCGLRRGELVGLALADYDQATGELKVLHAKGSKQRTTYVEGGAGAALADWLVIRGDWAGPLFCPVYRSSRMKRAGLTTQAVYHLLNKRAALAGVKALTPHDFRRTFIGDLLDAGADIATVQKMAGHSKVDTTARYDRRPEEAKRKAARLLHVPYTSRL